MTHKQRILQNNESGCPILPQPSNPRFEIVEAAHLDNVKSQPQGVGRRTQFLDLRHGSGIGRVRKDGHMREPGDEFRG